MIFLLDTNMHTYEYLHIYMNIFILGETFEMVIARNFPFTLNSTPTVPRWDPFRRDTGFKFDLRFLLYMPGRGSWKYIFFEFTGNSILNSVRFNRHRLHPVVPLLVLRLQIYCEEMKEKGGNETILWISGFCLRSYDFVLFERTFFFC